MIYLIFLIIGVCIGYLLACLLHASNDDYTIQESGYTTLEENCKGCMGPCGLCHIKDK